MISDTVKNQIIKAMKAKDELRLSTLKLLASGLHNAKIDNPKMTEEDERKVVKREAKKRKDAIEAYKKAGAQDRADKEVQELKILQEYLPEEMSNEELSKLVDEAILEAGAKTMADMGKVMKAAMAKVAGNADGNRVSDLVKQKLNA